MCTIIGLLALRYGEKDITRSDWYALVISVAAIIWWIITDDPTLSVILIVLIDVSSFYPMLRKTYRKPYEESLLSAVLNLIKFLLGFFALKNYTIASALFLGTNFLLVGTLLAVGLWRRAIIPRVITAFEPETIEGK